MSDDDQEGGGLSSLQQIARGLVMIVLLLALANFLFAKHAILGFRPNQILAGLVLLSVLFVAYLDRGAARR